MNPHKSIIDYNINLTILHKYPQINQHTMSIYPDRKGVRAGSTGGTWERGCRSQ